MKNYKPTLLTLLTIFFIGIILFGCNDDSISAKDERLAKERLEQESDWLNTPTINSDGVSYWYVVAEKKNKGYKISNVIKQDHKHFSIPEAKEEFGGDVFIINFIRVSKETYDELL